MNRRFSGPTTAFLAAAATVVGLASLFHIETRSPDFDPQYARTIVERRLVFGGSYYENGIHNKGPLETAAYDVVARLVPHDAFWFGIAVFVMLAAVAVGVAARRVVTLAGGPSWLGWTAFVVVYLHLTLSGADYAGVLYSRNLTVTLLSAAFILLSSPSATPEQGRWWRLRIVTAGVCLGLVVQTLMTGVLSATVIGVYGLVRIPASHSQTRRLPHRVLFVGAALVAALSAVVWYRVLGPWREFWDGWWTYGRYMSAATGRSLAEQLGLGWHEWYLWCGAHAPAVCGVAAFIVFGRVRWSRLPVPLRQIHVVLPSWWVAAWLEIILTQRYSSHYFVTAAAPLGLMLTVLAWHVIDMLAISGARPITGRVAAPAVVVISLVWSGTGPIVEGLRDASRFRGVTALTQEREQARGGTSRAVQAVLDMVSRPNDPMLAWTNYPWPYLEFHRVSASRFIWKSFLMGEIYLGRTSSEYVLPGSWDNWRRDVAAADSVAFLLDATFPVPADTPAEEVLTREFREGLFTPTLSVALRRDVADELARRSTTPWQIGAPPPGWVANGSDGLRFEADGADPGSMRLDLGDLTCGRWDVELLQGAGLSFHFDDPSGKLEALEMFIDNDQVVARSPNVEFLRLQSPRVGGTVVSLVVGRNVAVLLVDGVVRSGLTMVSPSHVTLSSVGGEAVLRDASVGAAPLLGQCG